MPKYDYSSCGLYFVTLCTHGRKPTLGSIRRGDPCGRPRWSPTVLGQIAAQDLVFIQNTFAITIDKFVIMPNHIHLLVFIPEQRATARVAPTQTQDSKSSYSLGKVIGGYKSRVSHDYLQFCKNAVRLWGNSGSGATTTISFGVRRIISAFGNMWMKTPSDGRRTSIILNKYRRKPYV